MVSVHHSGVPAATRPRAWRQGHLRLPGPAAAATSWPPLSAVGLLCAVAVIATHLIAPGVLDRASIAIGVLGILIGVPHGSVDHLVPFWQSGRRITVVGLARVLIGYVAVAALAVAALVVAPSVTFVVFLLASALHFGQAEVEFVAERRGRWQTRSPATDWLRATAHGLTVVVVPLALWHSRVHDLLTQLAPVLAGRIAGAVLTALAVVAVGLDVALLLLDLAAQRNEEAVETVLLVLLMATVPPVPAFAVYFGAWHALRHTARLLTLPGPGGVPLSVRAACRRYVVHAAAPTLVVLIALSVVVAAGSRSVLASALVVLIALTFPHMRTVAALDRSRRTPAATQG